jgi:hypothetical protein
MKTLPSTFTASTVSPDGNVESAGYFNKENTGIEVTIPLDASDNSLSGGKIRLQAKAGANTWASVADFNTVLGSDFTAGYKVVSVDSGGTDSTDLDELTGFAENENLYFRAILLDVAGNQRTGSESATEMVVDQEQPTISSVSSSSDNGSYKSGTTINIDVTSLEVLNVTGTPQITLETGDTDVTVDYSSGSATATLTFVYTVDNGQTSADLDVENVNALALNSGTIYDDAGNALVLTLPAPGEANSLGDNKDIIVDTDAPTASIAYSDSLVKENDVVNISVIFDAAMTSAPQIAIAYAGGSELDTVNMSQVNDTVWAYNNITIPDGNDGAATVSIIGTDIAENALTNPNSSFRSLMRLDNTHPTFTLLSPDSSEYVNHTLVGYKLSETSFSGTITWTRVGGTADANSPHAVTLTEDELDQATTFSDYTLDNVPTNLVSGTNYSLTWSATDSAGNISSNFVSTPVYYDTTAPTAVLTYSHYFASEDTVVIITATFNERALPTPQIAIDYQGTGSDFSSTNMSIGSDSTIWTYNATIPAGVGNDGYASVSIIATDLAENSLRTSGLTNTDTLLIDNTAPTAIIIYSDSLVKEDDAVTVTVVFSEQLLSIPQIGIVYAGGTELDTTIMISNTDTIWTKDITIPDGNDGAAVVSIIAKDKSGNFLTNENTTNRSLMRLDNVHPTFTLLSPDSGNYVNSRNVGYKLSETSFSGTITWTRVGGTADANSPYAVTLAASELDQATTFDDYTLTNDPTTPVSGTNYSITWSATDSAGNISNDFVSTPVFYDTTAPTAALTYSRYFASEDSVVTITATFNERALPTPQIAIDYAGAGDDVAATNMTIGADSTIWTYAATIPAGEANNGAVSVSITATDLATNSLQAVDVTGTDTLVVDNTIPTVTFSYANVTQPTVVNKGKAGDIVNVTAQFSEPANTDDVPVLNIDYAADSLRSAAASSFSNDDSTWVFQITLPAGTDDTGLMTATLVAKDRGGNPVATYTNNNIFLVDNTPPEVTLTSPDSGAYVNHRNIGYQLSENVLSGTVTWTRLGGEADANSPHAETLAASELDAAIAFTDYTLTSDPTTLVSGTNYSITWSVTDSVGNVSSDYIETPVFYDTTAPTAALTYSRYFASEDSVVTITATFNERALPTPQIAIDYAGAGDDVAATNMTIGADSTIWTYAATIPAGDDNNGIATVSLTATDLALNVLRTADVANNDTLEIDNTIPSITLSYINTTQTNLSNEGKYQDVLTILAQFTEKAGTEQPPTMNIEYSDSTDDSFVNMASDSSSNNDSVWVFQVTLPDSIKNTGTMTVSLNATDRAGNTVTVFNNNQDFTVDNTPPVDFATGTVTPMGINPVNGWLNGITDSIEIILPVPTPSSDLTLFLGGELGIQIYNKTRGVPGKQVGVTDSLTGSGSAIQFFRTYDEITTALPPNIDLIQGDSLLIRAVMYDRVGNSTYGDSSVNELVYDPFPTNLGQISGGIFVTNDTIISSDLVSANWTTFDDSVYQLIDGSGLARYDFKILHFDSSGTFIDNLINWTSVSLNEQFSVDTLGIQHQHQYTALIRAIDVAGNISDSVSTDTIRRINSASIIAEITETVQAYEDLAFTQTIQFSDIDTATILGDQFTYKLLTTHQYGHVPADTAVFLSGQNIISWSPTQSDTGLYSVRVIIDDNWNFSDTISIR